MSEEVGPTSRASGISAARSAAEVIGSRVDSAISPLQCLRPLDRWIEHKDSSSASAISSDPLAVAIATSAEGVPLGRSRPRLVLRPHCGFVELMAVQVVEEVVQTRRGEAHD